jgi:hypothetical protein
MSVDGFSALVRAALAEDMTPRQRAVLDAHMAKAAERRGHPRRHVWQRLTTRTSLLVAALVLVVLPSLFAVSASLLMTESPFGLSSSAEFQREIDAAKAVTPIPSGSSWPATLQVRPGDYYSRGGAYQSVESTAMCLWFADWLNADGAADKGRASAAAEVIRGFPTWRSYTGAFATQSYRDVIDRVIDAVRRDDRGPVLSYIALNCGSTTR